MIVATVGALCFVAGVVVGSGVAFILEDRKGKKAKLDSDYKWRTDMSYLLGHLIDPSGLRDRDHPRKLVPRRRPGGPLPVRYVRRAV